MVSSHIAQLIKYRTNNALIEKKNIYTIVQMSKIYISYIYILSYDIYIVILILYILHNTTY